MKKGNKVKVFYTPDQVLHKNINASYSKSPLKPMLLMEQFKTLGLDKFMDVDGTFKPFDREDFMITHTEEYVDAVFNGTTGCETNSVPWSEELANTVRYTNASLYNAMRHALLNPDVPTFSPTSGFHHAHPHRGAGFCTFAGQVIAAVKLYREFGVSGAFFDLDGHFGNSIEDCRSYCPDVNLAIPRGTMRHNGYNYNPQGTDERYLESLREGLAKMRIEILEGRCQYVVWCHGADSHHEDDLGGQVSTEHWVQAATEFYTWVQKMDEELASLGRPALPVTMSLFGGYRKDSYESVLSLHTKDMVECLNILCGNEIAYEAQVVSKYGPRTIEPTVTNRIRPLTSNERLIVTFLKTVREQGIDDYFGGKELGARLKEWKNHSMGKWALNLISMRLLEGSPRVGYRFKLD